MPLRLRAILFAVAFALLALAPRAWAAPGVTVSMISSPALTLDSNKPCVEGPQAAYVAFKVTNASGAALADVRAGISGFANGIALGGGQPAEQYLGTLAAGAVRVLYWYVQYPCGVFGATSTLLVSVRDVTPGATTGTGAVTTTSMVSAQAGGVLTSGLMGAGAVVGQTINFDVAYEFGGVSAGDSYNLQVAGNKDFNAGCFQLVKMEVLTSSVSGAPAGQADVPYFVAPSNVGGSKIPISVRYWFKYKCANMITRARPYGNQFSGGQLKYSSNYETFVGPPFPEGTNPFVVSKSVTPERLPTGDSVVYTVTIANPSGYASALDSIVDVIPAGVNYQRVAAGSGVTLASSGSAPAQNATGRTVWRGNPGAYVIPANGALTLRYTASVTSTPGRYTNTATAFIEAVQLGPSVTATVTVGTADVSVGKTGPATAVVGDTVRYVLTLANAGPAPAFNVVMTDTLPAGVTFLRATNSATAVGRVVTWPAIATLANGAVRTDTVVVLAPASLGTLVNVVVATSSSFDPAAGNNNGTAEGARATTTVGSAVVVTPDGLASPTARLANGRYSQAFNVRNASPTAGSYALSLRTTAAGAGEVFMAVDSVTGPGIATPAAYATAPVPLAGRTSYVYTVWYRVATGGDTAAINTQFLRAQAAADTLQRDDGFAEVRRVRPTLTLAKSVSPAGTLAAGTDLTYTLNVANVGEWAARSVTVTDTVPRQVMFKVGTVSQTLPSGVTAAVTYRDSTGALITPGAPACAAVAGHDSCVRQIIWTLSGDLPAGTTPSTPSTPSTAYTGTFTFVARIK